MKRILIVFFLAFATLPCRAQWQSVDFGLEVFALGTQDTFLFISSPTDVFRYTVAHGYAYASFGIDSSQGYVTSFASLGRYVFAGMTTGVGSPGTSWRSSDNGNQWFASLSGNVCVASPYVFNASEGIYRSADSGAYNPWEQVSSFNASNVFASGVYVFASNADSLWRSTDTGGTWNPVTTPISNITCFAVVGTAIYAANGTQLMVSSDSGAKWSLVSTNFSVSKLATNGTRLFAGGPSGVYLLDTSGITWIAESDTGIVGGHEVVALGVLDTFLFADFAFGTPGDAYPLYRHSIPQMASPPSAVQATHPGDTLSIYPNPATDQVTILSGGTSIYGVSVLNVLGENVLDVPNLRESDITLDLSKLPSGTYFLEIQTANGSVLRKVVVQH